MKNAGVICEVLKRRVKKATVETKSVYEEYPYIHNGVQHTTDYFKISAFSKDVFFPELCCGLSPEKYSSFYGTIRGIE